MKTKVSTEYILWLRNELKKINMLKIQDIEFFKDGMILECPKKIIDDFKFTGLNNTDFIELGLYNELDTETDKQPPTQ